MHEKVLKGRFYRCGFDCKAAVYGSAYFLCTFHVEHSTAQESEVLTMKKFYIYGTPHDFKGLAEYLNPDHSKVKFYSAPELHPAPADHAFPIQWKSTTPARIPGMFASYWPMRSPVKDRPAVAARRRTLTAASTCNALIVAGKPKFYLSVVAAFRARGREIYYWNGTELIDTDQTPNRTRRIVINTMTAPGKAWYGFSGTGEEDAEPEWLLWERQERERSKQMDAFQPFDYSGLYHQIYNTMYPRHTGIFAMSGSLYFRARFNFQWALIATGERQALDNAPPPERPWNYTPDNIDTKVSSDDCTYTPPLTPARQRKLDKAWTLKNITAQMDKTELTLTIAERPADYQTHSTDNAHRTDEEAKHALKLHQMFHSIEWKLEIWCKLYR